VIGKVLFVVAWACVCGTLWLVGRALSRAQDDDG
jgi:hypothetical protein